MIAILVLAVMAWPAGAQPYKGGRFPPSDDRRMPPPSRDVDHRRDSRDPRDMRDRGRPDRLSPEERRQLREDIGQHGREIYRDRKSKR